MSRYRDPQLQVDEKYSYSFNLRSNMTHFVPNKWDLNGRIKGMKNYRRKGLIIENSSQEYVTRVLKGLQVELSIYKQCVILSRHGRDKSTS